MKISDYLARYKNVKIAGDTAVIDIFGIIGIAGFDFVSWSIEYDNRQSTVISKIKALAELDGNPVKKLCLNINSLGGYCEHAIGLFDFVASLGLEIETRCFGQVASAATILAQVGKTRKISANIRYLVHRCWTDASGNAFEMEQTAEALKNTDTRMINLYATRSGKTIDEITELMNRDGGTGVWLTAEEALALGLADEIVPAQEAVACADPSLFKMFSLPALPEAVNHTQKPAAPAANNQGDNEMDKETIAKANGLFGAEFVGTALAEGLDFSAMSEKFAKHSSARIAELETSNNTLKTERDTLAAKVSQLEAAAKVPAGGADPAPPAPPATPEAPAADPKNEKKPDTVAAMVEDVWNQTKKGAAK